MPRLSANLLPTSTTPTITGTPEDFIGEKVKGDGYYGFSDGFHTVAHFISDFVGTLEVQGALAANPAEDDWVTISTVQGLTGTPFSENGSYNFTGNFVWIRAKVTNMEEGTIAKILLNH